MNRNSHLHSNFTAKRLVIATSALLRPLLMNNRIDRGHCDRIDPIIWCATHRIRNRSARSGDIAVRWIGPRFDQSPHRQFARWTNVRSPAKVRMLTMMVVVRRSMMQMVFAFASYPMGFGSDVIVVVVIVVIVRLVGRIVVIVVVGIDFVLRQRHKRCAGTFGVERRVAMLENTNRTSAIAIES